MPGILGDALLTGAMAGKGVLGPTLSAYSPTWRERAAQWLLGDRYGAAKQNFVQGLMGTTGLGQSGMGLADLTPAGVPMAVQEAYRSGDPQGMALAVAPMGAAYRGMGRSAKVALPMDEASRMARADAMGMRRNMDLYHGTGETFSELKAVPTNADGLVTPGVSTALDPRVANEFAVLGRNAQASPQVHRLWHRAERPAAIDLTGHESHAQVVETLRDAFDRGHDAVMLRNYTTPGGLTQQKIIIVRDANQLRSPNAAFDPEKRGSADLLASIAGAGFVASGMGSIGSQQSDGL